MHWGALAKLGKIGSSGFIQQNLPIDAMTSIAPLCTARHFKISANNAWRRWCGGLLWLSTSRQGQDLELDIITFEFLIRIVWYPKQAVNFCLFFKSLSLKRSNAHMGCGCVGWAGTLNIQSKYGLIASPHCNSYSTLRQRGVIVNAQALGLCQEVLTGSRSTNLPSKLLGFRQSPSQMLLTHEECKVCIVNFKNI